jgi:repressor LexA
MPASLTNYPERTLTVLRDYWAANRAMPAFTAVAREVGASVSTIADAVNKLKAAGFVGAGPTGRLQPGRRFFERPLLGRVQAGLPAEAPVLEAEGMLIDEYLVDSPSDTFLLTIRGQSMQDVGLLPGDVVVVNRRSSAEIGDIVVALVADAATVKQLAREEGGGLYLRARNPDFPDIYPVQDTELIGVVVGQFRKYGRVTNINI